MYSKQTTILVEGLQAVCYVGVPADEREAPQVILLDIQCELEHPDVLTDDMASSVNYATIVDQTRAMLQARTFVLLEVLVEAVAEGCFREELVGRVTVRARKPQKLGACEAVGVERVFTRHAGASMGGFGA